MASCRIDATDGKHAIHTRRKGDGIHGPITDGCHDSNTIVTCVLNGLAHNKVVGIGSETEIDDVRTQRYGFRDTLCQRIGITCIARADHGYAKDFSSRS